MARKTGGFFVLSLILAAACALCLMAPETALAKGAPTLSVSDASAQPGGTVALDVKIANNPGIIGATLELTYDFALTLTDVTNGAAFKALDMTKPGKLQSGCRVHWDAADLEDADVRDGVVCTLKFSVAGGASGSKKVSLAAVSTDGQTDVIDRDLNSVDLKGASCTVAVGSSTGPDGWVNLGGRKGYRKGGKLVKGWMDLGSSKYWFHPDNAMATGWTDVTDSAGKTFHYYFNPASGNLVRNTWFEIDGHKYYFRPSGNVAHGWATISDGGVDKKYYFDDDYHLVTGWREIANGQGQTVRYYFRPSGSMATGWADIDGQKYWFRDSGSMATGFATVSDGSKRYFDQSGHMLVGWQTIGGKTFYFRDPSGAMQTGEATIDGTTYEFTASGTLKSVAVPAQSDDAVEFGAQAEEDVVELS